MIEKYLAGVAQEKTGGNARHASADAWEALGLHGYAAKKNGRDEDVPNFVMKIPTGGGKTFLAVKTIDIINSVYKKRRTGLALWIVPTDSIFRQTVQNIRDRSHPYRQHLDMASGGRTIICEKHRGKIDRFTPTDVEENLVVYVLMLQSAARDAEVRDDLRIFSDSGGFEAFFPPDDRADKHAKLLAAYPNLDVFADEGGHKNSERQVKTSLGNTLRLLSPIVILDESHRAYTRTAQETILGFNPSIIVELSATPSPASNVLVNITGKELNKEEMIKLDLHVINRQADEWKSVLHASRERRNELEKIALRHERATGIYIRPILLLQAERTGADQRGQGFIHASDIKEELLRLGVEEQEIAIKTSEQDELKAADDAGGLMSRECAIRYIITKYALQEGWDCPFAYVLGILAYHTNHAERALTQLIGRILRQPYAKKTGIAALDESYVYVYHQEAREVIEHIKRGLVGEGLGDISQNIQFSGDAAGERTAPGFATYQARKNFRQAAGKVMLPFFMVRDGKDWRRANYERDILSQIPWGGLTTAPLRRLALGDRMIIEEYVASLSDDERKVIESRVVSTTYQSVGYFDVSYAAEYLASIIPNPWIAYSFANATLRVLLKRYGQELVAKNFFFILFEAKKHIREWLDRTAQDIFLSTLKNDGMRLMLVRKGSYILPQKVNLRPVQPLLNPYHQPLQRSLFDFVPADAVNALERDVVYYLEDQDRLYFWYRNIAKNDYGIQAWRKDKIYADFVFAMSDKKRDDIGRVYVLETKGEHLAGNKETKYKQSVFTLCNKLLAQARPKGIFPPVASQDIEYKLLMQDEWERELNKIFNGSER